MDDFLEQFINGVYQVAQLELIEQFGYPPYRCSIIKFGGFQFSHNWYGKTRMNYDKVGNLKVFTKTIYLNSLFIHEHFALTNNPKYNLPSLANALAHEIAHCLRADYEPKEAVKHDFDHAFLTFGIEQYITDTYEYHLLKRLTQIQRKNLPKRTKNKTYA
jgi:hypothetical protein